MNEQHPLAGLPKFVSSVGVGALAAVDRLSWDSLANAVTPNRFGSRAGFALGGLNLFNRVQLLVKEDRRIFFLFGRRAAEPEVTMAARIWASLVPERLDATLGTPDAGTDVRVELPDLIEADAAPAEYFRYTRLIEDTAEIPATAANTLLLHIGAGEILAVYNVPRDGRLHEKHARIQSNPVTGPPRLIRDRTSSEAPLSVFLNFVAALELWSAGRLGTVDLPWPLADLEPSDIVQTVRSVIAAGSALRSATARDVVGRRLRSSVDESVVAGSQHFAALRVGAFGADLTLRLDADGNFARRNDDDPFNLAMRVEVADIGGRTRARCTPAIPDFLTRPEDLERFINPIVDERSFVRALTHKLDVDKETVQAFLLAKETRTIVFRAHRRARRRGRVDDDFVVWRGMLGPTDTVVVASVRYRIDSDELPKVRRASVEYAGPADESDVALDRDLVVYIRKVATTLQRWTSLGRQAA